MKYKVLIIDCGDDLGFIIVDDPKGYSLRFARRIRLKMRADITIKRLSEWFDENGVILN